jgi:hypothetical protein
MKILADASLPASLSSVPNPEGLSISRITGPLDDRALVQHAANGGFAAVIFSAPELLSDGELAKLAAEEGVSLVCSVTDDPIEAEMNVRRWLRQIMGRLGQREGKIIMLRRDGPH